MILSTAARPLWFPGYPRWDILQIYGDFGFFLPGKDFPGSRQHKKEKFIAFFVALDV